MRKFYVWKVLSEDGLLKNHHQVGPYYDAENFDNEYLTEAEAVEAYDKFKKRFEYQVENVMVLLTVYSTY